MQWIKSAFPILLSLSIGLVGVVIFFFLNTPMPWLLGSITAIVIASRFSFLPLASPKIFSAPARTILGITIGSAFNPQIIHHISDFFSSLILILPFVVVTTFAGVWYYTKILKYDIYTAYFSAIPGGLLEMVALAESFKTNLYRVVLNQSARLLFIVFTMPFIIEHFLHVHLDARSKITQPFSQTAWMDLFLMVLFALVGWRVALKLKIPGGTIIGPMILGVIAYSLDLIHSRPPSEVINFVQLILGTTVGFVFIGVSFKEIIKVLSQTLGYFFILATVSGLFIVLVMFLTNFQPLSILLAFSPGGQAEMNLISIVVGANLPYVALHHIVRLFLVMSIAPMLIKWVVKER